MKKFEGTPGKWQVVDNYEYYDEYTPETPQIYIWNGDEQSHKAICDLGEMGDMNYAEELANAHLIAAAPELASVLEKFVNGCYTGLSKVKLDELRQEAEKILSKAYNSTLN